MTNELIEKALTFRSTRRSGRVNIPVTKDECELFIEMIEGRLTVRQYAFAIGLEGLPGNVSHRTMTVIREGIKNGWLNLTYNK